MKNDTNRYSKMMIQGLKAALFLLLFLCMSVFSQVTAQTYIDVEPDDYPGEIGNLNRAIEENGADGVIFRLQRDEVYWTEATIINEDYHLIIEAEDGEGHPPIIRPGVDIDFEGHHPIHAENDVTVRGVYYAGIDDQGAWNGNMRIRTEGHTGTIENSYFAHHGCFILRSDADDISWFVSDSQFKHMGQTTDPSCGRVWDSRGNNADSLVFVNNTMYLGTHFPLRTFGGTVNYFEFDHNTVVDWGYHMEIGLAKELVFTNNHMVNIGWRGNSGRDGTGYADHSILTFMSADPIEAFDDADRDLVISNNNMGTMREEYVQVLQDHWDANIADGDSVAFTEEPAARPFIHDQMMDSTGFNLQELGVLVFEDNITENESELQFTDRPDYQNVVEYITAYLEDPSQDLPLPWDRRENLDGEDDNPPFSGAIGVDTWRDFSYSESAESYTAAEDGFPIGDLNWFPEMKDLWEAGETPTNVEEPDEVVTEFKLLGNYPNPFNPTTNIEYQLAAPSDVTLKVYNVLGQMVDNIELGAQSTGIHTVTYDAANLSSGSYLVRMEAGNRAQTMKITLIK